MSDTEKAVARRESPRNGLRLSPKKRAAARRYLEWTRSGFQTVGRTDEELAELEQIAGTDRNLERRLDRALAGKETVLHLLVLEELRARLADPNVAKLLRQSELVKTGEFLARSRGGEYKRKKSDAPSATGAKIEISLNLPYVEGYDEPRRANARVKATEEFGPGLLDGG